jgi:hypothetical protein
MVNPRGDEPKLLQHDAVWTCATWHDLFLLVWRGQATAARAVENVRFLDEFSAARPGGFCLLIVLEPSASPPDDRARQMLAECMRRNSQSVRGAAYFIPMEGFKGSLMRSVVTGLSLLARETFTTRVFARLPEATRWLGEQWPGASRATEVTQIEPLVQQLRARGQTLTGA